MREDDVSGSKLCGVVGSLSRTTSGERYSDVLGIANWQTVFFLFALPRHQYMFM